MCHPFVRKAGGAGVLCLVSLAVSLLVVTPLVVGPSWSWVFPSACVGVMVAAALAWDGIDVDRRSMRDDVVDLTPEFWVVMCCT